jgi:dimethylargininase
MFTRAIVRTPAPNFAAGETSADLGEPVFAEVLRQHARYCEVLRLCGLELIVLAADPDYPDSTFVEDAAVLTAKTAVLTRPGATSRAGEVDRIRPAIEGEFTHIREIKAPGTLDGGDICEADDHFFIGLSQRTNAAGAEQLGAILRSAGYTVSTLDIRNMTSILHLKSGVAYLGDKQLVVMEEMADRPEFAGYDRIVVRAEESYAANCLRVNDAVLMPAGYPHLQAQFEQRGHKVIPLEMSEFRKMDGGLSCLSLRW